MKFSLLVGLALAVPATILAAHATANMQDPGSGGTLYDHICYVAQHCRDAPQCPTVDGQCDSCSAYEYHRTCQNWLADGCVPRPVEAGGCGFLRQGVCGANNVCTVVIIENIPCDREHCWVSP